MVMGRRGGTMCKPQYWENAEHFWSAFFYTREKAMSRICASKTRRNLQTFGWCLQFIQLCLWAALSYFCLRKQSRENQYNGASRFKEKCLRKAQHYQSSLKEEKALFKMNSLTFAAKKPQPLLWKSDRKGGGRKGKSVTTVHREGGVKRGGGGDSSASLMQSLHGPGDM